MRHRFTWVFVGLLAAALLAPTVARAQGKVGFVDLSRALELTEAGKKIKKDLEAKKDELEIKVKEMELNLLNLRDDYNKKKSGLSPDAQRKKEDEIQQKGMEYQQFVQTAGLGFEQFKMDLLKGFITKMEEQTSKIAGAEGYDVVVLKVEDFLTGSSVVLYGSKNVDLTDKVIKKLNESGAK